MAYTPTNWVNGTTPINETNLNKIEQGIKNNADDIETNATAINDLENKFFIIDTGVTDTKTYTYESSSSYALHYYTSVTFSESFTTIPTVFIQLRSNSVRFW